MKRAWIWIAVGCAQPHHGADGGLDSSKIADASIADASIDASSPVNHWTFMGMTFSSDAAVCSQPSGYPYWLISSNPVQLPQQSLDVWLLNPYPPSPGTYTCVGNPNMMTAGQTVVAFSYPPGVWYSTGGTATVAIAGPKITVTFANLPVELGSTGTTTTLSGTVTCPTP